MSHDTRAWLPDERVAEQHAEFDRLATDAAMVLKERDCEVRRGPGMLSYAVFKGIYAPDVGCWWRSQWTAAWDSARRAWTVTLKRSEGTQYGEERSDETIIGTYEGPQPAITQLLRSGDV
jgi:hypothetical protein